MTKAKLQALVGAMLPCPFCGSAPNTEDPAGALYPAKRDRTLWRAGCGHCTATVLGWSPEHAVEEWNRRPI